MFNFFRRKKSHGDEKKKNSNKGRNAQEKVVPGVEVGCGKFATPQSCADSRSEATAARSDKDRTSEPIGPPLPPKPTFRAPAIGGVPKPPVVGLLSPGPTAVMGNDSSQPLDTSDVLNNIPDLPFVDCTSKDISEITDLPSEVYSEHKSAVNSTISRDPPSIKERGEKSSAYSENKKPEFQELPSSETVSDKLNKNCTHILVENTTETKPEVMKVDRPLKESLESICITENVHVANSISPSNTATLDADYTLDSLSISDEDKSALKINNEFSENISGNDLVHNSYTDNVLKFENNINTVEISLANGNIEEKSVTDNVGDYVLDLASIRLVASCEEYSTGNSPGSESAAVGSSSADVTPPSGEEMQRIRSYPQSLDKTDGLNGVNTYENLKNGVSEKCSFEGNGPLSKSVGETDLCHLGEKCDDANKSESDETSEDESSECEDSDSDNVVKNDSGCWDERDNSLFLSESDNQVTTTSSLTSVTSILRDGKFREKKHVKWADLDGQKELTYEKEHTDNFEEESTSEEDESEDGDEADDGREGGDNNDSEETESEESDDDETEKSVEELKVEEPKNEIDYKREDTWIDINSSSEEDEEESDEEENDIQCNSTLHSSPSEKNSEVPSSEKAEEMSESEESSTEEECSEDERVKDEEPKVLKLDISEMHNRITELQKDIDNKTTNIDRLQVELDAACNESELVRQRFKRLEADLESYKQTNNELLERIQITEHNEIEKVSQSTQKLEAAERRIRELEIELEKVKAEYNNLSSSYKKLQADRDMEVQIIQKALEKALTGQEEMEAKYEKEFEKLRTLNSSQEVQMLEDFEWKLREVERNCKKKMQEHEAEYDKKSLDLASKLATAQADLEQISHLKLCEIELNQLKQTSSEQRKNLRLANRKLEELQVSEKILQEEVHTLRSSLDKEKAHIVALQTMHKEELTEKDKKLKLKLELEIKHLTEEWEERLRKQNFKIKTELERIAKEEKMIAVDSSNKIKEKEIAQLKQNWEKKAQEFKTEIEKYKKKISEIEGQRRSDLDNAQTNADRELFDMRRKMDKLDMSYQEKIEKIQERHETELATMKDDCERRVQQAEANLQLQIGNSRATLELVKQQIRNEAQIRMEKIENEYKQRLEEQWISLQREKDSALELLEQKHQKEMEAIYTELENLKKQSRNDHDSLTRKRNQQPNQSSRQPALQPKLRIQENDREHSQNPISTRLDVAVVAEEIRTQGKEEVLQRSIEQLTRQLNAGKMEIEKLRQQLEARDNRQQQQSQQQQRNPQQPQPNQRRNRKGRSGRN